MQTPVRFNEEEFARLKKITPIYQWGLETLLTKLRIVHEDLRNFQSKDVIDYIASRIKTPESIAQKLHGLGVEVTAESAREHLRDIAGIRILCPFSVDIYFLADLIRSIPDLRIESEKDYVGKPKPSGYRSYHIIAHVPVFYSGKMDEVAVEIQIRTEAMNFWATLEHKVRYKYKGDIPKHLSDELASIADQISEMDNRMYKIYDIISLINDK
ncbi:MAG: GTP pyrophosphokinase family protein [Defluviitaleaceae bacterium]|nr:GTP pyrophosphokinase family protein [Defluviitaleaceae bacterium]